MSQSAVSFTNAKVAMTRVGLPTSTGTDWMPVDQASWNTFVAQQYSVGGYSAGPLQGLYPANYGFVYPGEMPQAITNLVAADTYTATLAASEYTGAVPQTITLTLTETNGNGSSFLWTFGDGTTATTTTASTTHDYTVAGTYIPSVVPTVNDFAESSVAVTTNIVLT